MKKTKLVLVLMMIICQIVVGGCSSTPQNENKTTQTNGEQIIVGEARVMIPNGWKFDCYLQIDDGECYVYTKDLSTLVISSRQMEWQGSENRDRQIEKEREEQEEKYLRAKRQIEEELIERLQISEANYEYEISDVHKYPIGQGYGIALNMRGYFNLMELDDLFSHVSEKIEEDKIYDCGEYSDFIYSEHIKYGIVGNGINCNDKQMKALVDETVNTMQEVQCVEEERKTEGKRIRVGNMNVLLPNGWTLYNHTTDEIEDYYLYTKDLCSIIVKATKKTDLSKEAIDEQIEQDLKRFSEYVNDKNTIVGSDIQNYSFGKGYRRWNNRIFSSDDPYNTLLNNFIPGFQDRIVKEEKIAYSIDTRTIIYSDNWEYMIIGMGIDYDIEQMKALISDMVDRFEECGDENAY